MDSNIGPVKGEEKLDGRKSAQANGGTSAPEGSEVSMIDSIPFLIIAVARARVVSPPKRGHLEEVAVHGQRREPKRGMNL